MMASEREASFRAFFEIATGGFTPYAWQIHVALDGLPNARAVSGDHDVD